MYLHASKSDSTTQKATTYWSSSSKWLSLCKPTDPFLEVCSPLVVFPDDYFNSSFPVFAFCCNGLRTQTHTMNYRESRNGWMFSKFPSKYSGIKNAKESMLILFELMYQQPTLSQSSAITNSKSDSTNFIFPTINKGWYLTALSASPTSAQP